MKRVGVEPTVIGSSPTSPSLGDPPGATHVAVCGVRRADRHYGSAWSARWRGRTIKIHSVSRPGVQCQNHR